MAASAKLAFGVEVEVLLKPMKQLIAELEKSCPQWAAKFEQAKEAESEAAAQEGTGTNANVNTAKAEADALRLWLRKELATLLIRNGIPTSTRSSNYKEWSIVDEPALDEVPGYCKFS